MNLKDNTRYFLTHDNRLFKTVESHIPEFGLIGQIRVDCFDWQPNIWCLSFFTSEYIKMNGEEISEKEVKQYKIKANLKSE